MEHREDHNEIPEFTLEDILAEFGSGSDLYRTEDLPAEENSPETAPAEAPAQQEASAEPEPHAEPETSAAAELPGRPEGLRFTPGADPVDMDFPAEVLEEVFSSGGPLLPEEDQPPETQIIHFPHQPGPEEDGKPAAETTATEASSAENAPEEEPAEEPQETPEPQEAPKVSLEQIMNDTVSSVLEEQEDGILEERPPLREVLRHWWEKLTRPRSAAPIPQDTETLWEQPQEPQPEPEPDPEPDMDVAVRAEKRRCARLKRQCWCVLPEAVLLTALSVLDGLGLYIPRLWAALPVLRGIIPGGSLLLALALSGRVWRSARKQLSQRRITCETAALLASLVCLGDCVYAALGYGEQLPLAAVPVISLLLCLWGQLLAAKARLAGFRLADLGGEPPYNVSVTPAGACKQQGTAEGFYRLSHQPDVSYRWQIILTPLALAAASILAAVVCFGGEGQPVRPLWIWSALLSGGLPLALPVAGTLPLSSLNRRLNRSGSAVAGFSGADIECLINEAGLCSVVAERNCITQEDIEDAINKIVFKSSKKIKPLDKQDREIVAVHEAGHLVACLLLKSDSVGGASILPQGKAGGHVKIAQCNRGVREKDEILDQIVIALSGKAAEKVFFENEEYLGATSDIEQAYEMVKRLVTGGCGYGFEYYFKADDSPFSSAILSEKKLQMIENKCDAVLLDCMEQASGLMSENIELVNKYVAALKRNFTLSRDDIMRIYKRELKKKEI